MLKPEPKKAKVPSTVRTIPRTPPDCPWQLTRAAVRKYRDLAIDRTGVNRVQSYEQASIDLAAIARDCVTSGRVPKELDNGSIQYRGPSPLRVRLIVVPRPPRSTALPQLVDVLPDHEGRRND